MLIEERPPSGAEVQEDSAGENRSCPGVLHTTGSAGATELGPEAPSPAGATAELRAGPASPALLQPPPCTSGGTRSPSDTAEREGRTFSMAQNRVRDLTSYEQPKTSVGPCALWV